MVPDHWSNDAMVSMDRCGLGEILVCTYHPLTSRANNKARAQISRATLQTMSDLCIASETPQSQLLYLGIVT